ncbi:uncharacterized protein BJX67DRAFT_361124 [Aspergillus lucknowensis]|uniref:Uncharacterized protein n=1 Tax=Aspergillus lucknowensis TaxID=176173 RepID=A0ABR4LIP4_9EURO
MILMLPLSPFSPTSANQSSFVQRALVLQTLLSTTTSSYNPFIGRRKPQLTTVRTCADPHPTPPSKHNSQPTLQWTTN